MKKISLGQTDNGRDIWALKVTKDAKTTADNTRPAVLYNAIQHAREWLAGETCRRTLDFFVDNYGRTGNAIDHDGDEIPTWRPSRSRRSWTRVSCGSCASPTRTATSTRSPPGNRLWRKNLRDNNGDGQITLGDGVDPNRNYATNWGFDEEGASDNPASETYRGPGPDSEAETQAMKKLWDMVDFTFMKNDHTAAELLLWPLGFQQYTTDARTIRSSRRSPVTTSTPRSPTRSGTPTTRSGRSPATGSTPTCRAELYITNGDTLDDAYRTHKILGYTPEGTPRPPRHRRQRVRVRGRRGGRSSSSSAGTCCSRSTSRSRPPTRRTPCRTWATRRRTSASTDFSHSCGDPQPVAGHGQARPRRRPAEVTGSTTARSQTVPTTEWQGGERYGKDTGVYYHRLRGVVTGTKPGDQRPGLVHRPGRQRQLAGVHLPGRASESGDRC